MLFSRSMPDCGAVTRAIACGREPLADELRMLRAARKDDAVAVGDRQRAAGQERRSGLPEPRQVLGQAPEIETRPPGRAAAPGDWSASGRANGRKPALTPDAVANRPAANPVAAIASRIHCGGSPLGRLQCRLRGAGDPAVRIEQRDEGEHRQAPLGRAQPLAARRGGVTHLVQLRDGAQQRCAHPRRCCRRRRSAVAPAAATDRQAAPDAPPSGCIRPRRRAA